MKTITHIVPLFAPVIDGVGDYALNLARTLRDSRGVNSRFVVCNPNWNGPEEVEGFEVMGPTRFKVAGLSVAMRNAETAILHYVGYGFHRKGTPLWLVRALEEWWRWNRGKRLVTIFHEIWSSGPPWRTVFFLGPIQRQLVARLLNLSAHGFISTRWARELLEAIQPGKTTLLPVSANIQSCSDAPARSRLQGPWRPMIFGQSWTRTAAVERHSRLLRRLSEKGDLEGVVLMGKEVAAEEVAALGGVVSPEKVVLVGEATEENAAREFQRADFILSAHDARDICKSSALMSAFSCECPAVVPNRRDPAPLVEDTHFFCCSGSELDVAEFERKISAGALPRVASEAQRWFRENAAWIVIAQAVAEKLEA